MLTISVHYYNGISARTLEARFPGQLKRSGLDLRLLPGDPVSAPHARRPGLLVVLRAESVTYSVDSGKGSCQMSGPAVNGAD